jgi:hypothetical protein
MNKHLLAAAALAAVTAVVHVVAGGADIATPLLASKLNEEPKITLYAAWHLVSVTLALSAGALCMGALPRYADASRHMVMFVSILWLCFGMVFLVVALTQPGEGLLFKLPQWVLLLPVGIFGLWGGNNMSVRGASR